MPTKSFKDLTLVVEKCKGKAFAREQTRSPCVWTCRDAANTSIFAYRSAAAMILHHLKSCVRCSPSAKTEKAAFWARRNYRERCTRWPFTNIKALAHNRSPSKTIRRPTCTTELINEVKPTSRRSQLSVTTSVLHHFFFRPVASNINFDLFERSRSHVQTWRQAPFFFLFVVPMTTVLVAQLCSCSKHGKTKHAKAERPEVGGLASVQLFVFVSLCSLIPTWYAGPICTSNEDKTLNLVFRFLSRQAALKRFVPLFDRILVERLLPETVRHLTLAACFVSSKVHWRLKLVRPFDLL